MQLLTSPVLVFLDMPEKWRLRASQACALNMSRCRCCHMYGIMQSLDAFLEEQRAISVRFKATFALLITLVKLSKRSSMTLKPQAAFLQPLILHYGRSFLDKKKSRFGG